jgi:opacity protein-like surface antigen
LFVRGREGLKKMPQTTIHTWASRASKLAAALLAAQLSGVVWGQEQVGVYARSNGLDRNPELSLRDEICLNSTSSNANSAVCATSGDAARISPVLNELNDAALGYRISPHWRVEAMMSYRVGLDLSGTPGTVNVAGDQGVAARGNTLSSFAVGYYDLPLIGRVQPFLGAGFGTSLNRAGGLQFMLPGMNARAAPITQSGRGSDLAYLITAGAAVSLRDGLTLDLTYRYSDLGEMRRDGRSAPAIRGPIKNQLDIGGTKASLEAHGITVNLRFDF